MKKVEKANHLRHLVPEKKMRNKTQNNNNLNGEIDKTEPTFGDRGMKGMRECGPRIFISNGKMRIQVIDVYTCFVAWWQKLLLFALSYLFVHSPRRMENTPTNKQPSKRTGIGKTCKDLPSIK